MQVTLNLSEQSTALRLAWDRILSSASIGINHQSTYKRTMAKRICEEFVGACAEVAISKATGRYFTPSVGTFHRVPDFMNDCEIRATDLATGCLIVRDNDPSDRKYLLAIVDGDVVTFAGGLPGVEAKQDRFLRDPHGYRQSWFVPQSELRPVEEFVDCLSNLPSPSPS